MVTNEVYGRSMCVVVIYHKATLSLLAAVWKLHYNISGMPYTVEPFCSGHSWDSAGCSVQRGVPRSEVQLYTTLCGWDCRQCPH